MSTRKQRIAKRLATLPPIPPYQSRPTKRSAHVVCLKCGTRWTAPWPSNTPRKCRNEECDAGWLDMPQFIDEADADRAYADHFEQ